MTALIVLNLLALTALTGAVALSLFWGVESRSRHERTGRNIRALCDRLSETEATVATLRDQLAVLAALDDAALAKAARAAVVDALRCAEDTLTHALDTEGKEPPDA